MAERSFAKEVESLRLGRGDVFEGEGILAITKALLQSGVGYVGGYQGAPISHLMDVLADAQDILGELGVRYEASASEAAATAMLAASVHYPIRGAVAFKSVVGLNVASDALSNLASGGVTGGALVIVGEDYGEGSSIMQERSHAFCMKSQVWMLDPRPDLPSIVGAVAHGFALSEASSTPVLLQVRIRCCHVTGRFEAADNVPPPLTVRDALEAPRRDPSRIVLPPASYAHEREKIAVRLPAALDYIRAHGLNETFGPGGGRVGIVCQGGLYNGVVRALQRLGLADDWGDGVVDVHCLNVTYPLDEDALLAFCDGRDAVLMVEEGQPDHLAQALGAMLHRAGSPTRLAGKDVLPMAGEYTGQAMLDGVRAFLAEHGGDLLGAADRAPNALPPAPPADLADAVPARPPGFCIGCPERPIFAATKLVEAELGPHHIASDIGCHLFSIMPPFDLGATTMGYGTGARLGLGLPRAGRAPVDLVPGRRGVLAQRADLVGGQRGVQRARRGHRDRGQLLLRRDRRTGRAVVAGRQPLAVDGPPDRGGRARPGRRMGAPDRPDVRRRPRARHAARGARDRRRRAEGHHRLLGVHAQPSAPGEAREGGRDPRGAARARPPLRRGRGHLHRRPCLHPAVGLPVAHAARPARPLARRPRGAHRALLRGLRQLRRGGGRGHPLPVVLAGRDGREPRRGRAPPRGLAGAPPRRAPASTRGAAAGDGGAVRDLAAPARTVRLAILAVGGQGGGVLTTWIRALAEGAGWHAQATSVPGVAQRTGATIYYVEMRAPDPDRPDRRPLFALMPAQGDVDVVIASELVEVGRALMRELVGPRTVLIGSTHRDLTISEKQVPGDGRRDPGPIHRHARATAARVVAFDMEAVARAEGSHVSAALLGALAGADALPFPPDAYRAVIETSGRGVAASLAAFDAAFLRAATPELARAEAAPAPQPPPALSGPADLLRAFAALQARVAAMPAPVRDMAARGLAKVVDYQDVAYGAEYLDRLDRCLAGDRAPHDFAGAAAKHVANAMAYDDVIRVADLKTRAARTDRVRREAGAPEGALVRVTEYFHPRGEEIAGLLPARLGAWVQAGPRRLARLDRLVNRGRRIRSDRTLPFALLWAVGGLRRHRRRLHRHAVEVAHLEAWLDLALGKRAADPALGTEILHCRRLIKGYSDTHARGLSKFDRVLSALPDLEGRQDAAAWIARLREAALRDADGDALDGALRTVRSMHEV